MIEILSFEIDTFRILLLKYKFIFEQLQKIFDEQFQLLSRSYNNQLKPMSIPTQTEINIQRFNYSKHKERLKDIKMNSTSEKFYSSIKGQKPQNKKKILMLELKRQQINQQNELLKYKMAQIRRRSRQVGEGNQKAIISKLIKEKQLSQDDQNKEGNKLEIFAQNQGQSFKCIIPAYNLKNKSEHQKPIKRYLLETSLKDTQKVQKKQYISLHFNKIKDYKELIRSVSINNQGEEIFYNEPEKNENRQIIYKRTRILQSMLSCLFQVSLLASRMIVVAYVMGYESQTLKLLLSENKTKELLKELDGNSQDLDNRLKIQKDQNGLRVLKISQKNQIFENKKNKFNSQNLKAKEKLKVQRQFLKRNYFIKNFNNIYSIDEAIKEKKVEPSNNLTEKELMMTFQRLGNNHRRWQDIDERKELNQVKMIKFQENYAPNKLICSRKHKEQNQDKLIKRQVKCHKEIVESCEGSVKKTTSRDNKQKVKKNILKHFQKKIQKTNQYLTQKQSKHSIIALKSSQKILGVQFNKKQKISFLNVQIQNQSSTTNFKNEQNIIRTSNKDKQEEKQIQEEYKSQFDEVKENKNYLQDFLDNKSKSKDQQIIYSQKFMVQDVKQEPRSNEFLLVQQDEQILEETQQINEEERDNLQYSQIKIKQQQKKSLKDDQKKIDNIVEQESKQYLQQQFE